ncbi:MAG: hypothetical protein M1150_00775 [Patescibacteria group bacterium]|nr:hypothetical protein [Patescibacteria group bacterium]
MWRVKDFNYVKDSGQARAITRRAVPITKFKGKISLNLVLVTTLLLLSALWFSAPKDISGALRQGDKALAAKNYQEAFAQYKKAALLDHFNPQPHFRLSTLYQLTNNWRQAKSELLLAAEFSTDSATLKAETQKVKNAIEEPEKIEEQITYWRNVVKEKPNYRDAWVQLAVNYYQLYEYPPAKASIDQALMLDPNFDPAKKLKALIP